MQPNFPESLLQPISVREQPFYQSTLSVFLIVQLICITLGMNIISSALHAVYVNNVSISSVYFELISGSILIIITSAIAVAIVRSLLSSFYTNQRAQQYPLSPWLWKKDWRNATIRCNTKINLIYGFLLFGGLGLWITVVVFVLLFENGLSDGKAFLIVIVNFALVCIVIYKSIPLLKQFFGFQSHGTGYLQIHRMPARIGHEFEATAMGLSDIVVFGDVSCSLRCTWLSHEKDTANEINLYSDQIIYHIQKPETNIESRIPVNFQIPNHLPPSNWLNNNRLVTWTITLELKDQEQPYSLEFEIPVFN